MALVTQGWECSITLIDGVGRTITKSYNMRDTVAADVKTDAAALAAALVDITDCSVKAYRYGEVFAEDSLSIPAGTVKAADKASITAYIDGSPNKTANLKVPGPVIGIFEGASGASASVVDVDDADLVVYGNLFKSTGTVYISDKEDAGAMIRGKRISAKDNGPTLT